MGGDAARPRGRDHHPATEGASMVGTDLARLGPDRRTDDHRPVGSVAVECAQAGLAALYRWRSLGTIARCRDGAAWRGRDPGLRDRGPHWRGRRAGGPLLSVPP